MAMRAFALIGLLVLCGQVTAACSQESTETPAPYKTDDDDAPFLHRDSQGVSFYLKNFEHHEGGPELKRAQVRVIGQPGSSRDLDELQTYEVSCDPAKSHVKGPLEGADENTVEFDPLTRSAVVADSDTGISDPHLATLLREAVCD